MREVVDSARFRKDLKRQRKRGKNIERLVEVVTLFAEKGSLPQAFHPHPLKGRWKGVWDCRIEPDWLLFYQVNDDAVVLYRTGTHADLLE